MDNIHNNIKIIYIIVLTIIFIFLIWYLFFKTRTTVTIKITEPQFNPNNPFINPTYPPYNPNQPKLSAQTIQPIYNCDNGNLHSLNGDICLGKDQGTSQLCYKVGISPTLNEPWYESINNIKCDNEACRNAKNICVGKPLCSEIGQQCNIDDLKTI